MASSFVKINLEKFFDENNFYYGFSLEPINPFTGMGVKEPEEENYYRIPYSNSKQLWNFDNKWGKYGWVFFADGNNNVIWVSDIVDTRNSYFIESIFLI